MEMQGSGALIQALVSGGKGWLIMTLVAGLPGVWVLALALHLGRPQMLRMLRKCTLRFGADVWWLSYVLLRDFALILAFALSFVFLMPDAVRANEMPLTGALSGLVLLWALAVKLTRDADDEARAFQVVTVLVVVAAALYFVPMVLGPKAAGPLEDSALSRFLITRDNVNVALGLVWVALAGYALTGVYIFVEVLRRSRPAVPGRAARSTQPTATTARATG